jgi:hypothetical protein
MKTSRLPETCLPYRIEIQQAGFAAARAHITYFVMIYSSLSALVKDIYFSFLFMPSVIT